MNRILLALVLSLGLVVTTANAAKKTKVAETEVDKALKERYPDAKTQVTGSSDINGVKVYDVKVTTAKGESTAQITEYGDFLMWGMPHEYSAIKTSIEQDVAGLFASKPENIDMYRVTTYDAVFKGPKGKDFTARFDAVGRLKDVENARETSQETGKSAHGSKISDADTIKKVEGYV